MSKNPTQTGTVGECVPKIKEGHQIPDTAISPSLVKMRRQLKSCHLKQKVKTYTP